MVGVFPLEDLTPSKGRDARITGLPGGPSLAGSEGEYFGHEWARWRRDTLDARVDDTLPTSRSADILDLGCATGARAADFARAGHRVTAVDCVDRVASMAERNAALAKDEFPPIAFVRGDIREPGSLPLDRHYDLIHLRRVLNFITLDETGALLEAMHPSLRRTGWLVASFIATGINDPIEMTRPMSPRGQKGGWTLQPGFHVHEFGDVVQVLDEHGLTVEEAFTDWVVEAGLIARTRPVDKRSRSGTG